MPPRLRTCAQRSSIVLERAFENAMVMLVNSPSSSGSVSNELNADENQAVAALTLRRKMGWQGKFAQGGNVKGDGYYFVNIEGA